MKTFTLILSNLILVAMMIMGSPKLLAQSDTVVVPAFDENSQPALYDFIIGDTTATGERNNPERVYKLQRGLVYPLKRTMAIDFDLTMIADEDDPSSPVRPPMLIAIENNDGDRPNPLLFSNKIGCTIILKNLIFQGVPADKGKTGVQRTAIQGAADSTRMFIDHCVFNGYRHSSVAMWRKGYKLYITNTIFRYGQANKSWWEGVSIMGWDVHGDSLVVENCTFFDNTAAALNIGKTNSFVNYVKFDHNTVMGSQFNVLYTFGQTNAYITNNLFIDTYAMGIDSGGVAAGWVDMDNLQGSIVPVDTNDADILMEEMGITEADRVMEVRNNVYWWADTIKKYWVARNFPWGDTNNVFMNTRDRSMFNDDANYPHLTETGNIEADPGFDPVLEKKVVEGFITYGNMLYDALESESKFVGYFHHYPDGNYVTDASDIDLPFDLPWPLPEDLSYSNETLKTYGTDGKPVGDLNWFGLPTGIKNVKKANHFGLSSYPNPFTTTTTISYQIDSKVNVRLSVYDLTGREVTVLINRLQVPGTYTIEWDGTNKSGTQLPGGIYIYRLSSGNHASAGKMIILR